MSIFIGILYPMNGPSMTIHKVFVLLELIFNYQSRSTFFGGKLKGACEEDCEIQGRPGDPQCGQPDSLALAVAGRHRIIVVDNSK
ncbi:hypothetical protein [Rhodoferax sp. UBA5149]|uniref:hypothetical protein n=1 Tax=Rhodoferax sp. UBA5149 TaxID=1947379 RepID=UPI0025D7498A|nr:hypothetical protein [Rhodoferax sp. UBA5149]